MRALAGARCRHRQCARRLRRRGHAGVAGAHLTQMCSHPDVPARQGMHTPGYAITRLCIPGKG